MLQNNDLQNKLVSDLKKKYDAEEGEGTLFTTARILIENYLLFVRSASSESEPTTDEIAIGLNQYLALEHFFDFRKSLIGVDNNGEDDGMKNVTFELFYRMLGDMEESLILKYLKVKPSTDLPFILLLMLWLESKSFREVLGNGTNDVQKNVFEFLYDISVVYSAAEVTLSKEDFIECAFISFHD